MFLNAQLRDQWFTENHPNGSDDPTEGFAGMDLPKATLSQSEVAALSATTRPVKRLKLTASHGVHDTRSAILTSIDLHIQNNQTKAKIHGLSQCHPIIGHLVRALGFVTPPKDEVGPRVTMPTISRAYAESYMRTVQFDGETPCSQGEQCECMRMATEVPFFKAENGFVGVAFPLPDQSEPVNGLCLLCNRKRTILLYYSSLMTRRRQTVLQTHSVRCEAGEYGTQACIMPIASSYNGIVAPFVKHERHHYVYINDHTLKHTPAVNFRYAPKSAEPD